LFKGTTIIAVRKGNQVAIGGDGQVTFSGNMIMKNNARKIRKLYNNKILAGFAGSVADALTLFDKFEKKLDEYNGNLQKAAVELTKDWRMDRVLRKLEALLIVANEEKTLIIAGSGEVIEPDDQVAAIGSGGGYALAAGKALVYNTHLSPGEIVFKSLEIAANICVFTNANITVEELS